MSQPERILHIVNNMNKGGLESRIMDIYRQIDRQKYQFDFYIESGEHGFYDDEIEYYGGKLYYNQSNHFMNIPRLFEFNQFLVSHSEEYRIVYSYNQWAGWYLKSAKKRGIAHRIAFSRTAVNSTSIRAIVKNLVKINAYKYATNCFAVSNKAGEWLFGKHEYMVWPNAIDVKKYRFSPMIRETVRNEMGLIGKRVFIHVGNMRDAKNPEFLIELFTGIKAKYNNAVLLLCGSDSENLIAPLIEKHSINDSVIQLGNRDDIWRLLQAGDVFLFPSKYEGFPGAVLEAEASGLRCLISNTITNEVIITNHIEALPINEGISIWLDEIEKNPLYNREDDCDNVCKAGYDISELVERTEAFFRSCIQ